MSDVTWRPEPAVVTEVTSSIVAELGSWGLGELGDQGLVDAIWDHYDLFWRLDEERQRAWVSAVREELGWAP